MQHDGINRRQFLNYAVDRDDARRDPGSMGSNPRPRDCFTFDDPTTDGGAGLTWPELNERILAALAGNNLKSILFVCGKRVNTRAGSQLIASWDRAGHLIGNHSYSHLNFNDSVDGDGSKAVRLAEFEADALKNEPLIRNYQHFDRMFRYPFFKEGDTVEKRDGMRAFLQQHGYRIGRATIDASDWAIDARLQKRVEASPHADLAGYRDFFLQHIWDRAQYYDALSERVLGQAGETYCGAASHGIERILSRRPDCHVPQEGLEAGRCRVCV